MANQQDSVFSRRKALASLLKEGAVDGRVLELIAPGGKPLPDEDQYWDFKESLPIPDLVRSAEERRDFDIKLSHIIKDIVSFYNINGGYIVVGVKDSDKFVTGWSHNFDAADVSKRVQGFTRRSIDIKYRVVRHYGKNLGLIYVPERPSGEEPAQFVKSAPEDNNGRRAFSSNDIYLRARDECRKAVSSDDFSILFRRDRLSSGIVPVSFSYLENNLPARDPSLLDFVGRQEQMDSLWRWFTERYTAVKLLSGPGGVGKTSIAWTFCDSVSHLPPEGIQKIVWLTAKKRTYAAIRGEYVEIAHTHFYDLDTLLRALIGELGVPDREIETIETREALIDAAIEAVSNWPCLLVVDDIDSLPTEEQFDVFRTVSTVFDRVIASGSSRARALLTARLTLGAAPGQLMMVGGMPLPDFEEYVKSTASAIGAPLASGQNWANDVRRLHEASSGSPMFAASILRLVSLGESLSSAIRQYKGAEGEEVRRFAFERELDRLTDSQSRLLYAAINLGDSTFLELLEVTQSNRTVLRDDIGSLRDYHLMAIEASVDDLARGISRVSVPAVIVAMSDLIRKKLDDPKRIESACARARRESENLGTAAGRHINEIMSFWSDDDFDRAVEASQVATKNIPSSPDLWCVLGRSYLKRGKRNDAKSADSAFRKAKELGCKRRELLPLWLGTKKELRDWLGMIQVVKGDSERPSGQSLLALAEAYRALGDEALLDGHFRQASENFRRGALEISSAFKEHRAHGFVEPLKDLKYDLAVAFVNAIARAIATDEQKIEVWLAVKLEIEMEVYHRGHLKLSILAMRQWWYKLKSWGKMDEGNAHKLIIEARAMDRVSHLLRDRGAMWVSFADQVRQAADEFKVLGEQALRMLQK